MDFEFDDDQEPQIENHEELLIDHLLDLILISYEEIYLKVPRSWWHKILEQFRTPALARVAGSRRRKDLTYICGERWQ